MPDLTEWCGEHAPAREESQAIDTMTVGKVIRDEAGTTILSKKVADELDELDDL